MTLKIYQCTCGNEYSSRQDPDAANTHDRPQCSQCGKRVNSY